MSFFGSHEDAVKLGTKATKVIDGEDSTSPIRDGGSDTGGASWDHGTAHFDNKEQHGRPIANQGRSMRRTYGLDHDVKPK